MEDVKMFLFARWIATCYEGILNTQDGEWYAEKLRDFNSKVYPEYEKNKTVHDTMKFLGITE